MKQRTFRTAERARASPASDALGDRRDPPKSEQQLPYQERIRLKKQAQRRKKREALRTTRKLRVGTFNVESMTGGGREVADMMERRSINNLCVQETRWKREKIRAMANGCKMYYGGHDQRRNGVGVVLNQEWENGVLQLYRESDRAMWLKME